MTDASSSLTFSSIRSAAGRLHGISRITPVMTSRQLDALIRGLVFLKCENFQRTGAFKFRGAYNALSLIHATAPHAHIATVSSGNHGQGLALAAGLLGMSAHVVMPRPFTQSKQDAILAYGGMVSTVDDRAAADKRLREVLEAQSAIYVHAFNDPGVMAGQGTVMLELADQAGNLDVLLAPVGGGGLLSGLCVAGHQLLPDLKIFACEPEGASDATESITANRIVPLANPRTIADGLRTTLGTQTLPILRAHLEGVLTVTEAEILAAIRFSCERLKLVIEPSSAVALAPLLRQDSVVIGKRVGVVLTGGNVDLDGFAQSLGQPLRGPGVR